MTPRQPGIMLMLPWNILLEPRSSLTLSSSSSCSHSSFIFDPSLLPKFDAEDMTCLSCQIWEPFTVYSGFLIGDQLPGMFSDTSEGCHPFYCHVAAACGLAAATCTPLACLIDASTCGQCDKHNNPCPTPHLPSKATTFLLHWLPVLCLYR